MMESKNTPAIFEDYAQKIVQTLRRNTFLPTFSECARLIDASLQDVPAWELALPAIVCAAVGGTEVNAIKAAIAWYPMYLASEILDSVEDDEFEPDQFISSPAVATNLATSLIFFSFHTLASIDDLDGVGRASREFASSGFSATLGQHQDLIKRSALVEDALNDYWDTIIQKSGSVFRMAAAGGASAGTADQTVIEALADYGTALGVLLQLMDDCRDAFSPGSDAIKWEVSLPLLLYLLDRGEEKVAFPGLQTRSEWGAVLNQSGVFHIITSILLEWKNRALASLSSLPPSVEKSMLEKIPALVLDRLASNIKKVSDGNPV